MTNKKESRVRGGASCAKTTSSDPANNMGAIVSSASASAPAETFDISMTTSANASNLDEPGQENSLIIYDNSESGLLKLPNEVKQRIWTYAVAVEEPIEPHQIRPKSNKFIWSKEQINQKNGQINIAGASQLTAVQLAKVCRSIYDDVATTHLFYVVNEFHFQDTWCRDPQPPVLIYLVAITEPRRKAIRSIRVPWQYLMSRATAAQIFTLITACQGLQLLDIKLDSYFPSSPERLPGFKECLIAVQGLKKLTITVEDGVYGSASGKELRKNLQPLLEERLALPRSRTYNLTKFSQAQMGAKLDIHGEGRLSEDKKPGQISSRTRQQVRNIEKMTADGTIPTRVSPKYDLNGDLTWIICAIEESREAVLDGIQSVEFYVQGGPSRNENNNRAIYVLDGREEKEKFWEDVTTLSSLGCRWRILDFYEKNPKAFGAQVVLDLWKLREFDGPDEKVKKMTEKRLQALITRKAAAEHKEDERAAKAVEAAKAAEKKARKANPAGSSNSLKGMSKRF